MKKLYFVLPVLGVLACAVFYNWQLAPNPWIVRDQNVGRDHRCSVHHVVMERRKVPVIYGTRAYFTWAELHMTGTGGDGLKEFLIAEKNLFPFSRTETYGGDEISNKAPAFAYIDVCPRCSEALTQWQVHRR